MRLASKNASGGQIYPSISILIFSVILTSPLQAQNNSWTNTGNGFWQDGTNWSQGAPASTQSGIFITNANTKTVTIDDTTTNFPGTMTVSNLTVTAPVGSVNTLNITNAGFDVPLTVLNALTVNSRGVLTLDGSRVQVSGSTLIGTTGVGEFSISDGRFNGAAIAVGSAAASSGKWNIGGGTSQLTGSFDIGGSAGSTGLVLVTGGYLVATNTTIDISVQNGLAKLITSNGIIRAAGYAVGNTANTVGILELSGGTNIATADTLIASRGNSTGMVVMTGGRFESTAFQDIVIGRGGYGEWTLTDGVMVTRNEAVGSFRSGDKAGTGKLTISGGTNQLTGTLTLGVISASIGTSTGTVNISGGVLDVRNGTALIGSDGVGFLSVSNGILLANNLTAGANPTNLIAKGTVTVAGGQVFVTNAAHSSVLEIRNGSLLIVSNGTITASRLVLTNLGTGLVTFNSGTLNILRTSIVANTQTFIVGDGTSTANLNLLGGTHSFANGLTLNANSALDGAGFSTMTLGGNLLLATNSNFIVDLSTNSATPGTGYDRAFVTGTVTVAESILTLNLTNFTAQQNAAFTIIDNDTADSVFGTFAGLANGSEFSSGGAQFKINYSGGTGNDVVLIVVPEPSALTFLAIGSLFFLLRSRRDQK